MIKHSYTIYLLVIVMLVFIIAIIVYLRAVFIQSLMRSYSAYEITEMMADDSNTTIFGIRSSWIDIITEFGKQSDYRDDLRIIAEYNNFQGDYANIALFRLRDDPDLRFITLMNRLFEVQGHEQHIVESHFLSSLDSNLDIEYCHPLLEYLNTEDIEDRKAIISGLSAFVSDQAVLETLLTLLYDEETEVRIASIKSLGAAESHNPAMNSMILISDALKDIVSNEVEEMDVRLKAVYSLGYYGWSVESEQVMLKFYRNGSTIERLEVLNGIDQWRPPDKALGILIPAYADKDPEVGFYAVIYSIPIYLEIAIALIALIGVIILIVLILKCLITWIKRLRLKIKGKKMRNNI